jgi:hypothetical protein
MPHAPWPPAVRLLRRAAAHGAAALLAAAGGAPAAEMADVRALPPDLAPPPMTDGPPAAGRRVRETLPGYEATPVYHALYLPADWQPGRKFPVIFEYPGNGGYTNKFGDVCHGTPEGCNLGYGASGGKGFIWVCLPFVAVTNGTKQLALKWWGDVGETVAYCRRAVAHVTERHGGDPDALILAGFSRGAIAGNFIGLHDAGIAPLWRAFICHSHYDGVRTGWPYPGADRASALVRLRRWGGRPQFISHEGSVTETEHYLGQTGVAGAFTFVALPWRNHTDDWVLRPSPERDRLRAWLAKALER